MIRTICMIAALACVCGGVEAADPSAPGSPGGNDDAKTNPRTVYFTVGDYQDLLYTPLDSPASIKAAFEVLKQKYDVARVWWRGGQDEIWGNQFLIRDHSRRYVRLWNWWMDLQYRVVGTNRIAVQAARDQGLEIYLTYGLFDNGSQADVGFGGFPYAAEDKIRVEHPEWAPVNKYGTWRQGGPIEFCYPEARKAMVDYLARYTIDGGYDGIAFLSYVENFSMHYEDEFGFNQPIVDEFKKRHGVDIRYESFDRDAWRKLRAEYLTQFMRELHAAMSAQGKKIAVSVDGRNPNLPCLWNLSGGVRTVGSLWMDIQTWVSEGIVDEINLYYPNTDEAIESVRQMCQGTKATVSVFGRSRGDSPGGQLPPGVGRLMTVNTELESGFDWDHYIDFPDESVVPQPPEALKSDDVYARRRAVTAIHKGKQTAPAADVLPLLEDGDVYVRRGAIRALAVLKDPSAIPALEEKLRSDPENGVRWLAAVALGQLRAPNCVATIFDAAGRDNGNYQLRFVVIPAILQELKASGNLSEQDVRHIIERASDANDVVRETAWYAMKVVHLGSESPDAQPAAIRALTEDDNPYVRELALSVLTDTPPTPEVIDAVSGAMQRDADVVVQARASAALASLARSSGTSEARAKAINDIEAFFRQYGEGTQRADHEWGWRESGNALRLLGEEGAAVLEKIMQEHDKDKRLADLAWRVLYLPQEQEFSFFTEQQDAENHAKHPYLKLSPREGASADAAGGNGS